MKKILLCFLILSMATTLTGCWTNKSGKKSGVIVKVAKEGRYWGTYEGELIRGGLENASGVTGRAFLFTLGQFKSDLVDKAQSAMESNKHVIITYHCEEFVFPWRGETNCFADDIKILDNKP
ncbi:hypothetical protein ACFORL_00800 [Legionella dresdenensis]|uniref:Secreted protein n=1 Tax=Legionella dresdenensis TaxID=450200 RepID=A0ABV8CBI8_9GAMM